MKPILWVLATLCFTLFVDLALSAPSKTNDVSPKLELINDHEIREKRASRTGQTQSQYLNYGDSQTEGKADAEITRYGSRASVSGSNGMGQAQSQSSGTGCDECYGSDNGYSRGGTGSGPDPLRSATGSSNGLPTQRQTSSNLGSIPSGSGFNIYGRPISGDVPIVGPSGYDSQGFGPSVGGRIPSEKIKDGYGYPLSGGDTLQQPGNLNNGFPPSQSVTDQTGIHGKTPTNLGSSSFLNRPIGSGKPSIQIDTSNGRPSILAGRKPSTSGIDSGKLVDGQGGYLPSHDTGSGSNIGRSTPNKLPSSHLPSYSQVHGGGSPVDNITPSPTISRQSPIRSGTYDSTPSGYPDRRSGGTGLQPIDKQPQDRYDKIHKTGTLIDNRNGPSSNVPSTEVLDGLRQVLKLPPGLCLVRCDTVRPGQSLTTDELTGILSPKDQFTQPGKPGQYPTIESQVLSGSQSLPDQQPSVYSQRGQQQIGGAQLPQSGTPSGQYPQTGTPSDQYPQTGTPPGQYPQTGTPSGQYPQTGTPAGQYPQAGTPTGQYQQTGTPSSQYPQTGTPSGQYPQTGTPSDQYPQTGTPPGQYPQTGTPSGQYPQTGIIPGQKQQPGYTQYQHISGQQYTQPGTGLGQYPQVAPGQQLPGGVTTSQGPLPGYSQYTPTGSQLPSIPQGQTQQGYGQYPQGGQSQPVIHQQTGGVTGLPTGQVPSQTGTVVQFQQTGTPSSQYPQTGTPSGQYQQTGTPSGQYPQTGTPSGQYPQASFPLGQQYTQAGTPSGQYPQGGVQQVPTYTQGPLVPGVTTSQGLLGGGYPQYTTPTTGSQIPSLSQVLPGQSQPGLSQYQPAGQTSTGAILLPASPIPGVQQQGGYLQTGGVSGLPTGQIPSQTGQWPGFQPIGQTPMGGQQYPSGGPAQPRFGGTDESGSAPVSGGAISSGGTQQAGGVAQYPSVFGPSQTQQTTTGAGQYLPQYPTSVGGGTAGLPAYPTTGYPGTADNIAIYPSGGQLGGGSFNGKVVGTGESEVSGGAASGDEDGFSQAESSIKNGEVVASAQGTKNGGTAQTQVQGTYSGTGSFSASAQTADKDRSAQAQVSGHKDGALSSSQGSGGKSQAQAQVEVNEKTGGTSASGQTSGLAHNSQSEVTANEKGGLADAQSSGPGQTSSQAQIGFRPEGESVQSQGSNIFNGGGQASAQSGVHSGLSQSQIQGNFKLGISYHGAAQAASGTKEQVISYREKSKKLFQSIGQFTRANRDAVTNAPVSDIANINDIGSKAKPTSLAPDVTPDDSSLEDDYTNDEGGDAYDDDYETTEKANGTKKTATKTSRMEVELPQKDVLDATPGKLKSTDVTTTATLHTKPTAIPTTKVMPSHRMPAIRSEIVPDGFKGKIDDKRQKNNLTSSLKNRLSNDDETKVDVKPDTYVTVTKSVSGSLDNAKTTQTDDKKFESTYYTKSSTCGYFTFSCNIVYGSNGRSKICRPKTPTNGKC
ncbi:hornerin isoform X2 [Contarinia nasturtii]|uniref:hornerin isoform X2 n=1 Tax=Contarinia nasturtii TaxID=265458 RepID=UPI0012D3D9D8|nr:hornerin isoform X2 [Contarinia nasturtii]